MTPFARRDRDEVVALSGRERERLLDEHVLAGLHREAGVLVMHCRRRCEHDRIDVVAGHEVTDIGDSY